MTRITFLLVAVLVGAPLVGGAALAQTAPRKAGHMVVVKLVDRGGSTPYAFEPARVAVQPGDTLWGIASTRTARSGDVQDTIDRIA